jgi:hypothetical protein
VEWYETIVHSTRTSRLVRASMSACVAPSPLTIFRIAREEHMSAYSNTELDARKIVPLEMDLQRSGGTECKADPRRIVRRCSHAR